ncbi:MAG TPA: hypothetical protein VIF86_02190 [Methylobacter sp.]|jgi:hypothetical protein
MDTPEIIIGILAASIAFFQLETSDKQQKHDLFDRRFKIYDATRALIYSVQQSIAKNEVPNTKELDKFDSSIKEAEWILNTEMDNYLKEFQEKFLALVDVITKLEPGITEADKKAYVSRKEAIKEWFDKQNKELKENFAEFLQLDPTTFNKIKNIFSKK